MNSVRGSCKDGRDGAGDLPSSHRLAVISGSVMSAALYPYCSDFIAAPRPARRRSPIRRHRNETFAVRLGTRVPRSGVGPGFVYYIYIYIYDEYRRRKLTTRNGARRARDRAQSRCMSRVRWSVRVRLGARECRVMGRGSGVAVHDEYDE